MLPKTQSFMGTNPHSGACNDPDPETLWMDLGGTAGQR